MIFTITVMKFTEDNSDIKRQRTWGYAETFEEAQKWVLENDCDIFEDGYYQHAVIEKYAPNLSIPEQENWYFASYEQAHLTGSIVKYSTKPDALKGVCSFAFG